MAADPGATCTVHTIHLILNLNPKKGLTNPICCQVNRFIVTLSTMLPWMMCEGRKKPEQQEGWRSSALLTTSQVLASLTP